jgi:hypothetical protein
MLWLFLAGLIFYLATSSPGSDGGGSNAFIKGANAGIPVTLVCLLLLGLLGYPLQFQLTIAAIAGLATGMLMQWWHSPDQDLESDNPKPVGERKKHQPNSLSSVQKKLKAEQKLQRERQKQKRKSPPTSSNDNS